MEYPSLVDIATIIWLVQIFIKPALVLLVDCCISTWTDGGIPDRQNPEK